MPKKKNVNSFITDLRSRKIFYRQKIPDSIFARKETVDIDIPITSRNCDMQPIRTMSGPATGMRKWDQFSQFR